MTPEQFTTWLNGFTAALGDNIPTDAQFQIIKEKLQSVFHKVTPDRSKISPAPNIFECLEMVPDCNSTNKNSISYGRVDFRPKYKDGVLQNIEELDSFHLFNEKPKCGLSLADENVVWGT